MPQRQLYLKSAGDFKRIVKTGEKKLTPFFLLFFHRNESENRGRRVGISISRANVPLATDRNRLKRLVREFWRMPESGRYSIEAVLIVRKNANQLSNGNIYKALLNIFNKTLS